MRRFGILLLGMLALVAGDSVSRQAQSTTPATVALDQSLLYDILLAHIAKRRGQNHTALHSLASAATRAENQKLLEESIALAFSTKNYQQAITLAKLLIQLAPDEYTAKLALAGAQLNADRRDDAIQLLLSVAADARETPQAFWDIAGLIARQHRMSRARPRTLDAFVDAIDASGEAWFAAALAASNLKQTQRFEKFLDRALEAAPDLEAAATAKLRHLFNTARDDYADYARQRLRAHPKHNDFRMQFAELLQRESRLHAALHEFRHVLRQDADADDARLNIALIHFDRADWRRAQKTLQHYLRDNPDNDRAAFHLAHIHYLHGDYARASLLLRKIYSPEYHFISQTTLAKVIAKQTDWQTGAKYLRRIDAETQDDKVHVILTHDSILREHEQYAAAKQLLDDALREYPRDAELLYGRGLLAVDMHMLDLHERDMRAVIKIQPRDAAAYNALGYTLTDKTERHAEALDLIDKALQIQPNNPLILDSMGWVQYRIGNYQSAITYLGRAMHLKRDAEIAAHLGEVLWQQGDKWRARRIWARAREWEADNETLNETLRRLTAADAKS